MKQHQNIDFKITSHKNVILEDYVLSENDDDNYELCTEKKSIFKGILKNTTNKKITELKYNLRFYDNEKNLLGIEKQKFISDDEIDKSEDLVIYIPYDLPENCKEMNFHVKATREFKIFNLICSTIFGLFIFLYIGGKIVKYFINN